MAQERSRKMILAHGLEIFWGRIGCYHGPCKFGDLQRFWGTHVRVSRVYIPVTQVQIALPDLLVFYRNFHYLCATNRCPPLLTPALQCYSCSHLSSVQTQPLVWTIFLYQGILQAVKSHLLDFNVCSLLCQCTSGPEQVSATAHHWVNCLCT